MTLLVGHAQWGLPVAGFKMASVVSQQGRFGAVGLDKLSLGSMFEVYSL